jgi:N-acetylglutamate synthase-like GNAT family acetyltransferase
MLTIKIVNTLSNTAEVNELIYIAYPYESNDIEPVFESKEIEKLIKLEKISFLIKLQDTPKHYILAEDDGRLVGFTMINTLALQHLCDLSWVCVHPDYRNQNIGRQMITKAVNFCKSQNKEVVISTNIPDYYRLLGFDICNEFKQGWYLMSTKSHL